MNPPDPLAYTFCEAFVRGWGVAANCRPCGDVKKLSDRQLAERLIQQLDRSSINHKVSRMELDSHHGCDR
jgi:hypothetical protein